MFIRSVEKSFIYNLEVNDKELRLISEALNTLCCISPIDNEIKHQMLKILNNLKEASL